MLLLWHRPAAVALILPLAWELPYAADVALKRKKKKERKKLEMVDMAWLKMEGISDLRSLEYYNGFVI